jgi:hypothetical protein
MAMEVVSAGPRPDQVTAISAPHSARLRSVRILYTSGCHTMRQNQWHSAWSKIFECFQRFCAIQRAHCNLIFGVKVTNSPFLGSETNRRSRSHTSRSWDRVRRCVCAVWAAGRCEWSAAAGCSHLNCYALPAHASLSSLMCASIVHCAALRCVAKVGTQASQDRVRRLRLRRTVGLERSGGLLSLELPCPGPCHLMPPILV